MSNSLQPHGIYCPWSSPGQNTGVDSLSLLQGSFPTQGLNPGLLHYRQILYKLTHREAQRVSESQANVSESRHSSDSSLLQIKAQTPCFILQETPVYRSIQCIQCTRNKKWGRMKTSLNITRPFILFWGAIFKIIFYWSIVNL